MTLTLFYGECINTALVQNLIYNLVTFSKC